MAPFGQAVNLINDGISYIEFLIDLAEVLPESLYLETLRGDVNKEVFAMRKITLEDALLFSIVI